MADEVATPDEAPEPERSETPAEEPITTQTSSERAAELQKTIADLNAQRPAPKVVQSLTPGGAVEQEVHEEEAVAENKRIDEAIRAPQEELNRMQKIEDAREWAHKHGIKKKFNQDRSQDRGRER